MRFEYISMKELDRTSVPFCWCHNHHVLDNPFADTPKYHIVELSPKYHIVELSLSSCFPGYCKSQLLTFPHYLPWYLMTSIISRLSPNRIHSNIQYIHHLSNYINIKKKKTEVPLNPSINPSCLVHHFLCFGDFHRVFFPRGHRATVPSFGRLLGQVAGGDTLEGREVILSDSRASRPVLWIENDRWIMMDRFDWLWGWYTVWWYDDMIFSWVHHGI
jgi:hypothetical protein